MEVESTIEIKNPDRLLLLEINQRVSNLVNRIKDDLNINEIDLKMLEIDKDSLSEYQRTTKSGNKIMASNLTKKIEYLLESVEKD